jgi:predicted permease
VWHGFRVDYYPLLRTTTVSTPAIWKLRGLLVVSQIALSIVLLVGASLLTRSVVQLLAEDHGFTPAGVLAAKIVLSDRPLGGEEQRGFISDLHARVRALPGVTLAGLGNALPPSPRLITVAGQIIEKSEGIDETHFVKIGSATPDFLRALGAQFLSGRDFRDADGDVVVLSESTARFLLRNRNPIGEYVSPPAIGIFKFAGKPRVIGVVRDIKYEGLDSMPGATVYVPWDSRPMGTTHLVVRFSGDVTQLSAAIRRIVRELDPAIPVSDIQPLESLMASSIANRRLRMFPAIGFALLALVVALMGLLATLSRTVAERRQELAIRAAVGASARQLVWMIVAKGLFLTALGVTVGLAAAWMVRQNLAHLLFGVTPSDPLTFGGVALLVSVGAGLAVFLAARRAAHSDPLAALRYE